MIIALVCGSRGLGSRPGWVTELCYWEKHFTLTMPLFTQENPVNCHLLGGNLVMTGIPWRGGGGVVILLVVSSEGNWEKLLLAGPLGSSTDLGLTFFLNDYNKHVCYPVKFQNNRILSLKFAIWGS